MESDNMAREVPELTDAGRRRLERFSKEGNSPKREYIPNVDGRQKRARDMYKLYNEFVTDMGGDNYATAAQKELARRCATLAILAKDLEEEIAEQQDLGEPVSKQVFAQYMDVCKTSATLMAKLNRVKVSDKEPQSLSDYLAEGD